RPPDARPQRINRVEPIADRAADPVDRMATRAADAALSAAGWLPRRRRAVAPTAARPPAGGRPPRLHVVAPAAAPPPGGQPPRPRGGLLGQKELQADRGRCRSVADLPAGGAASHRRPVVATFRARGRGGRAETAESRRPAAAPSGRNRVALAG